MYSSCIFCNRPLGTNQVLEHFPVGERLAFDGAKGRLWVVCRSCERWNLTPLEERWEAIEEAERLFSETRRRVSTDNIGLARMADGTTLVRIGEARRPEFAAWRYGDQFGQRRRRSLLMATGGVGAVSALVLGGAAAGVAVGGFSFLMVRMGQAAIYGSPNAVVARVRALETGLMEIRRRHLAESSLGINEAGELTFDLRFKKGGHRFTGPEAQRLAATLVPKVNRWGGRRADIADAVRDIESFGHPEAYLRHAATMSRSLVKAFPDEVKKSKRQQHESRFHKYGLFSLPASYRLGIEMALHEEAERRALEGELAELERAWQDAEEIAAISDDLLLPTSIMDRLRGLKPGA